MLTRIYKNNNFTVKHEPFYDGDAPATMGELIEAINNDIDAPDVEDIEETYAGNSYAYYYVTFFVNGAPRYYRFDSEMLDAYRAGHTIRFIFEDNAPLFVMPTYTGYADAINTTTGQKGTIYHLETMPDDETADAMKRAGCDLITAQYRYAPELKHPAVFVPNGVCFSFC